jgi:integrase
MAIAVEVVVHGVFRAGFRACGIEPMTRVHNLRHTYATTAIEAHVDDLALAYRMAHASSSFTRSVYGHIRHAVRQSAADIYSELSRAA